MKKTAVVLLNLGSPSGPETIRPFLFNFFIDKNIISAPLPIRYFLAHWISWNRSRGAAKASYAHLGGKSPLLKNTQAQAEALEKSLLAKGVNAKVFISMRYWHPLSNEVVSQVKAWAPEKVVLLPLYPQYSTATTKSSFEDWEKTAKKSGLSAVTRKINDYPDNEGFIRASVKAIQAELEKAPKGTRLLFSAHGLPEKTIRAGDPYQYQCKVTAKAIVRELGIPGLDWQECYQSRVGPLKWIGPSTEEALEKAAMDKVPGVVVYTHAFVSEHVETLVEIDIEYREKAEELGIPYFSRVQTVGAHPDFIDGLAALVLKEG